MERLCDRVSSSTLLEDRRDAVRALKSLSKVRKFAVASVVLSLFICVDYLGILLPYQCAYKSIVGDGSEKVQFHDQRSFILIKGKWCRTYFCSSMSHMLSVQTVICIKSARETQLVQI